MHGVNVNWVDTLANLRGISGTQATNPVIVLGGHSSVAPPDGGGGLFYWDHLSVETDNGGTIVRPTAIPPGSPGRWTRMYSGALDVRWFGATGKGIADDQPALQAIVNYVVSVGGGTIYFPAGTYRLDAAIHVNGGGVRLIGDNRSGAYLAKTGADATTVLFGAVQRCELSHLRFKPTTVGAQTTGATIRFSSSGVNGILLSNLSIEDVWCGIMCDVPSVAGSSANEVAIKHVKMNGIFQYGMYAQNALNWTVSDVVIVMRILQGQTPLQAWPGGSNKLGIWMDTWTEGWILDSVFVLGGEHCWRFNNIANPSLDPPASNRFISCIGDNGSVSCFYATALHRSFFIGCWASAQSNGAVGFATDSLNVRGLEWLDGEMMNMAGHCFNIINASDVTIGNSYLTAWGVQSDNAWAAIHIRGSQQMSFSITGNTFSSAQDAKYGAHSAYGIIVNQSPVPGGITAHDRYIVANNRGAVRVSLLLENNSPLPFRRYVGGNVS